MTDAASLGTILGVWAHPDDDIFLTAGLMTTAVRAGNRVVDVTATRGEGGSMDEERWPPATMGAVRTKELLRSLEILGVAEHRFLEGPVDVDMDEHLDRYAPVTQWPRDVVGSRASFAEPLRARVLLSLMVVTINLLAVKPDHDGGVRFA